MATNHQTLEPTRTRRYGLAAVVMFLGGSGLVYEYCISTLATHLLGNSVEQFSLIIALMLFAMGIAGLFQKNIKGTAHLASIFILVEIALAVIGGTSAVTLYLSFAWMDHFHLVLYVLALTIGFGIGLEIPLLLRINERWRDELSDNIGEILSLDYVGALLGALIWAFILLPVLPLDRISLLLGLANLGAAALTWILLKPIVTKPRLLGFALCLAVAILTAVTIYAPDWKAKARQDLYAYPIRHHVHSPYQDIVVTGSGRRMSLYLNGRLQFDSEDEFIYHEMLVHPAMMAAKSARRVLVLGGGDGLAVREILRWPTVKEVLLVDLDPAVTKLAQQYPPLAQLNGQALNDSRVRTVIAPATDGARVPVLKASERPRDALKGLSKRVAEVTVRNYDADRFLRDASGQWDVIIADFPDPSTPDLAKLYSAEFYAQVRRSLSPGGVFALQSGSPYASRSAFWSVRHTLEDVGLKTRSLHAHVPTFGEWGWHVGMVGSRPEFERPLPAGLRYLDMEVLKASQIFAAPMLARPSDLRVSTRIDPWVMRLYQKGERIVGPRFFPGTDDD